MAVEWFCKLMGSEVGPLSQEQLVDMVRSHRVNPEDLVRRNRSQWVPAFEVRGLFEAAAKTVAAVRPQPTAPVEEPLQPSDDEPLWTNADVIKPRPSDFAGDDSDWYCIASGQKRGPLQFHELRDLVVQGKLRERDRVWRGSAPKWKMAVDVEGLIAPN